jgi:hypothetical protein
MRHECAVIQPQELWLGGSADVQLELSADPPGHVDDAASVSDHLPVQQDHVLVAFAEEQVVRLNVIVDERPRAGLEQGGPGCPKVPSDPVPQA